MSAGYSAGLSTIAPPSVGPLVPPPKRYVRTLVPLYRHPLEDPAGWQTATRLGPGDTALVKIDEGLGQGRDAVYAAAMTRLTTTGVSLVGYVDLDGAQRPLAAILADVQAWAAYPVNGVFLDRAPVDRVDAGPVALAVRVARRAGLPEVVLNPGIPVDPLYRELDIRICTFDGHWSDYTRWDGGGGLPGDGHLVHGVPVSDTPLAWRLLAARGAGLALVTDREPPAPFAALPRWCDTGLGARP